MKQVFNWKTFKSLCGTGILAVAVVSCSSIQPPTEQLAISRLAVSNASDAGANQYANGDMNSAQDKLDRAVIAMHAEEYKTALTLAEQAQVDAQLATSKTQAAKAEQAAKTVNEDSRVLQDELKRKHQ